MISLSRCKSCTPISESGHGPGGNLPLQCGAAPSDPQVGGVSIAAQPSQCPTRARLVAGGPAVAGLGGVPATDGSSRVGAT